MNALSRYEHWLESYSIDDETVGRAYESLGNQGRAVLKKAIARLYRVWGESPEEKRKKIAFRDGFGLQEDNVPAPFALMACDPAYCSPSAMLAALLPALLAGVETVLPCFTATDEEGCPEVFPPLLGALELAGVERGFAAPESRVEALFADMVELFGHGRLIILGGERFADKLALSAHRAGVPCCSLTNALLYYNSGAESLAKQCFSASGEPLAHEVAEADETGVFLHLDAAHEDVWFWPDLGPGWFRSRRMRVYAL